MKVKLVCQQCLQESIINEESIDKAAFQDPFFFHTAHDMTDDGTIEFCCKYGHKNYYFLQNPKYEVLFDIGFSAYKDGYYREACLDFAACIERFHEYCLFAMLCQNHKMDCDELKNMWKVISKQSERQYGAFVALYTNSIGNAPQKQGGSFIEFRNNITHKGKMPSKEDTLKYAKYTSDYISKIYQSLEPNIEMWKGNIPKIVRLTKEEKNTTTMMISTILSSICCGETFEEAVQAYEKMFGTVYEK